VENVAHNLCNSNNTALSIGIIQVTIYSANGKVSHVHRRMCQWEYTEWITRSFVNKTKEGGHVGIRSKNCLPLASTCVHSRCFILRSPFYWSF